METVNELLKQPIEIPNVDCWVAFILDGEGNLLSELWSFVSLYDLLIKLGNRTPPEASRIDVRYLTGKWRSCPNSNKDSKENTKKEDKNA